MNPLWVKMGLSQVDRERLAIGRWPSYIPYQNVGTYQCTPPGTRLSKYQFDNLLNSKAIDISAVEDTLVQLYKLGLCDFNQMAVVSGKRGIHIVPPKWCNPEDTNNYSPEGDKVHLLKEEDDIKSLSCLTMYVGTWGIIAFHDTGSSITLHTKKFRQTLPEECRKWVSKVATRYTRFKGIKGEETVLTDVFKWDLGWNKAQQGVTIYSVEYQKSSST